MGSWTVKNPVLNDAEHGSILLSKCGVYSKARSILYSLHDDTWLENKGFWETAHKEIWGAQRNTL